MTSLTLEAFARRWAGSGLSERSGYQQHFLDLCDVLGAPKPAETDPHGEFLGSEYDFGVLHSRAHELWSIRMGTWMRVGNDLRYTPTTCFETFPFPEPTEADRASISDAARRLDELRRNWLDPEGATEAELKKRTLTNLYNARPTWLDNTHRRLDAAVFAAYGWPADISDEDILKNLLALNLGRSANG